ncbi:MAG: hypothetical protein NWE92_10840 [Candidatus Bathyarchaeota archaeon]|nr:hypothetical protein [Candidatus Bathyarchaeota archaeon]
MTQCVSGRKIKLDGSQRRWLPENKQLTDVFQLLLLCVISEGKPLSKQGINKALKNKIGLNINTETLDTLLDALWFEDMICSVPFNGKSHFILTEKGKMMLEANLKSHRRT